MAVEFSQADLDVFDAIASKIPPTLSKYPDNTLYYRGAVALARTALNTRGHAGNNAAMAYILGSQNIPRCQPYDNEASLGKRHLGLSSAFGNFRMAPESQIQEATLRLAIAVNSLSPDAVHIERIAFFVVCMEAREIDTVLISSSLRGGSMFNICGKRVRLPILPDLPAHARVPWDTSPYNPPLELPV